MMRHVLLLAAVLMGGCGEIRDPAPAKVRTLTIAKFPGQDQISVEYALRVLAFHGISADGWGSLGVKIDVDESQAEESIALLNEVLDIRPFVAPTSVSDWPVREWENDMLVDVSLEEALDMHDATSLVGCIIREAAKSRPRSILVRYPVVERVKWRTRPFVHRDLTPATATEAVVLFAREKGGARSREQYVSIYPQH